VKQTFKTFKGIMKEITADLKSRGDWRRDVSENGTAHDCAACFPEALPIPFEPPSLPGNGAP